MSQVPPNQPLPNNPLEGAGPHTETGDHEEVYYEGSPMVRGQLGKVVLWALVGIVLIAIPFAWKALQKDHHWPIWWITLAAIIIGLIILFIPLVLIRSVSYRISNYRIDYERGILTKKIDTLELWHVEDISFSQSLIDRILGVGNIRIMSHDETTPELMLRGLPNPRPLFESLKQRVIAVKRQRGVLKMDMG